MSCNLAEDFAAIICEVYRPNYYLEYEMNGLVANIFLIGQDKKRKQIGSLLFDATYKTLTLKKKTKESEDFILVSWEIVGKLRAIDNIEIDENIGENKLRRHYISVGKAIRSCEYRDLSKSGGEKMILIPKTEMKNKTFKWNHAQKKYIEYKEKAEKNDKKTA